jgi:ketopantoate reductase
MLNRTPQDWLTSAIAARSVAAHLSDPEARKVMEEVADECESIAQDVGAIVATLKR